MEATTQDPTDRALFFSSTYIQVGDGRNTPFWKAKWLNAAALKDIVSNLYKMARMKNMIVSVELHNHSWIKKSKRNQQLYNVGGIHQVVHCPVHCDPHGSG
jgi:hypothetical protein